MLLQEAEAEVAGGIEFAKASPAPLDRRGHPLRLRELSDDRAGPEPRAPAR